MRACVLACVRVCVRAWLCRVGCVFEVYPYLVGCPVSLIQLPSLSMNPSCRIQRTSCFSVLTPRLLHSQASATGSDKPTVVAVGEMLRRVDNSCLMRWSSYICSHYKYSFLQQLLPARNASTRRSGSAHAKVELHKVTYTFKQADDARAEVAAGTEFPGIRLATVDPVVEEVPEGSVRRAAGSSGLREVFQKDGFVEVPQLVSKETAQELVAALDAVLAGRFDTGPYCPPLTCLLVVCLVRPSLRATGASVCDGSCLHVACVCM